MTSSTETIKDEMNNQNVVENKTDNKAIVSACGCDTDHYGGVYISSTYKGKRIYFCAEDCKDEFLDDPEAFLDSDHFLLDFELLEDE